MRTDVEGANAHRTAVSADDTHLAYEEFGTGMPLIRSAVRLLPGR